jgi:hypothetical protein
MRVIVVVIVPILVGVPAVGIFIPPFVFVFPAPLPRLVQLKAPMLGLLALVSAVLNGFVQPVVRARDATLTIVISAQPRRARER